MAPEVIDRQPYSTAVDIWSFGVVVIEMVDGQPCLYEESPTVAMKLISDGVTPHLKRPGQVS